MLLAELLLVQTKADDVARVWPGLVLRYPTPATMANARRETLIRLLQPLGLQRQRARALKTLARNLVVCHDGKIPRSIEGLLSLPHVGLYVAAAVACFGFNECVPIVDVNVIRVMDRITGIQGIRELRRRPDVWRLAWALLPRTNTTSHNYGLLDFAAIVCTPKAPRCGACGLRSICTYGLQQQSAQSTRCKGS
jgi:A/G-specific adenine glycosylase